MGVFSNYITEGYTDSPVLPNVTIESLLMDDNIVPCEENFLIASARVCAENNINMNAIMQACAIQEFCYFEENGVEMVYTENAISGFFEKAKSFFKKLWEKIQGIFKRAVMMFNSKAMNDKDFLAKYKKEITKARNSSYGDTEISIYNYAFYNGYDFAAQKNWGAGDAKTNLGTNLLSGTRADDVVQNVCAKAGATELSSKLADLRRKSGTDDTKELDDQIKTQMEKIGESDWKDELLDEIRGNLIKLVDGSYTGKPSASEFSKDMSEALQGDSGKEEVAMSTALDKAVAYLEKSKDIVKGLDTMLKWWKKDIDGEIRSLERAQKQLTKNPNNEVSGDQKANNYVHGVYSAAISVDKDIKNIGVTAHGLIINHLKACSGQSKSICVKAINYKAPKNESYAYSEETYGNSLLDSIEMI